MMHDPQEELARHFLESYLHEKGHTWESLRTLPAAEARQIFVDASTYTALKLAEIEDKAHLAHELHQGAGPGTRPHFIS